MKKTNWTSKLNLKKIVTLLFVAGVVLFVYKTIFASKQNQVTLQTATVERGSIVSSISASGTVVSANIFTINTSASGVVKKVYVKDGDKVVKGQKIAEVELDLDGEQQYAQAYSSYVSSLNQLSSAQNNLRSATASLNNTYDQIKGHDNDESFSMIETRTKSEIAKDNAYNSVKVAQAALDTSSFNLKANSPTIVSPNSGVIYSLTIAEGLPLNAQTTSTGTRTGQRVASIVKTGKPLISVNLSEIDVPKVKVGQKATIKIDSLETKTFTGVVTAIDRIGSTISNVTSYPAIITLDTGSDEILSNMAVTANIINEVKNDVLTIPTSALKTNNDKTTVTIIKNGQQETINVRIGLTSDTQIEIVSGLDQGQEVITGSALNSSTSSGSSEQKSVFSGVGGARFISR